MLKAIFSQNAFSLFHFIAKYSPLMKERVPFAVVGSNTIIEGEGGKKSRGRKYPWGVVDIENLQHCDFLPLRNMLIKVLFYPKLNITRA